MSTEPEGRRNVTPWHDAPLIRERAPIMAGGLDVVNTPPHPSGARQASTEEPLQRGAVGEPPQRPRPASDRATSL